MSEYRCYLCGKTYENSVSDEEMLLEAHMSGAIGRGLGADEELCIVCEDCVKLIPPHSRCAGIDMRPN